MPDDDAPAPGRPTRVRAAVRQNAIVDELRRRIVVGEFPPGGQLPKRRDLITALDVSSATLQRALDLLTAEGFVTSRRSQGTFVTADPPHLTRYGLVFPWAPDKDQEWNRFWTALVNEATRLHNDTGVDLRIYYGTLGNPGSPSFRRLLDDVERHQLAGLIFAHPPEAYRETPLLAGDVPCVALTESWLPGVVRVNFDLASFVERAVAHLAGCGCTRIALLGNGHFIVHPEMAQAQERALRQHRCSSRPAWQLAVDILAPSTATNLMRLLFAPGNSQHPDGLVIADDNLVEAATAGLVAEQIKVGRALHVVAHCNFPWPTPSVVPVTRLGFDAGHLLREALAAVMARRHGRPVQVLTRIPAVFEHELGGATSAPG